jgi:hypothetical protein
MLELMIIAVIVGWAGWYSWKKLSKTASGKQACCEQDEGCAFKGFIEKEGNGERLSCSETDRNNRVAKNRAKSKQ